MKQEKLRRLLFVSAVCLLSLPWLTPCVALLPVVVMQRTANKLSPSDPTKLSPLKRSALADKSDVPFVVRANQRISPALLISATEWDRLAQEDILLFGDSIYGGVEQTARFFEGIGPGNNIQGNSQKPASSGERRKEVVLSHQPLVLLQADRLLFVRPNFKALPMLAEARMDRMLARVTIHTSAGNLFVTAQRICFRASSSELILEGNAVVQSGRRQIKAASPKALMRVNILTQTVDVGGATTESLF